MRLSSTWKSFAALSVLALAVVLPARAQEPASLPSGLDDDATTAIAKALATVGGKPSFYCDLTQMTKSERKRYDKLIKKLDFARREFVEIPDGYSVSLPKGTVTLVELADFLTLEDKCCPFFAFTVAVAPGQSATTLKIHGPDGVKKFIRSVFSEGLSAPAEK